MDLTKPASCPKCELLLEAIEGDQHARRCNQCQGLFLQAEGVREQILQDAQPAQQAITEDAASAATATPRAVAPPACCPSCAEPMMHLRFADVEFQRCANCAGLWIERGVPLELFSNQSPFSLSRLLTYSISLPERTLRSTAGLAGGMAKELADRLIPRALHSSNTYKILVHNSLRFLVEEVGGVQRRPNKEEPPMGENYLARKTVGDFIGMAGIATLHFSPVWVLAVASDLAYGSRVYLKELADELRKEGLLAEDSPIDNVDDLLGALGSASGATAKLFDTPPLSLYELRESAQSIQHAVTSLGPARLLPQTDIQRLWTQMRSLADRDRVSLFQLSSAVTLHTLGRIPGVGRGTLTGLRLAAGMVNQHIFTHYAQALHEIREKGFYATLSEVSEPYLLAVWKNFSTTQSTITEDVLSGKLPGEFWHKLTSWFRRSPAQSDSPANAGAEHS